MPSNSIPRLAVSVLILSLCGIQAIAATPTTQFGRVEVSESPNQTGPLVLSSVSDGELELVVGFAPGAELFVNPFPPDAPIMGVSGSAVASADNFVVASFASVRYEYTFRLTSNAEIEILSFLGDEPVDGASASFSLERDDESVLFLDRPITRARADDFRGQALLPGDYRLAITASAEAKIGEPRGQRFIQADFAFAFATVPEPGAVLLAAFAAAAAVVTRRR